MFFDKKKVFGVVAVIAISLTIIMFSSNIENSLQEQEYLNSIHSMNHYIVETKSDSELLRLGYGTCDLLYARNTADEILVQIVKAENNDHPAVPYYAAIVVSEGIRYFCPEYFDEIEAWVY